MNRIELQQALEMTREQLLSMIEGQPDEFFHEAGVMDDWTLKDILAHINRWEGLSVTLLWKLKQGHSDKRLEIHGQDQIDDLNAQWHQEDRDRPLALVMEDFNGLRKQTIRRLQEFSDEELTQTDYFDDLRGEPLWKWIAVDTFEHEQEHMPAIRTWLEDRQPPFGRL